MYLEHIRTITTNMKAQLKNEGGSSDEGWCSTESFVVIWHTELSRLVTL